jgi:hypothetical protein
MVGVNSVPRAGEGVISGPNMQAGGLPHQPFPHSSSVAGSCVLQWAPDSDVHLTGDASQTSLESISPNIWLQTLQTDIKLTTAGFPGEESPGIHSPHGLV